MEKKEKTPYFLSKTKAFFEMVGYHCTIVEYSSKHSNTKHDMFGFIDIYAFKAGHPDIAIQSTTMQNVSHHVKKIAMLPIAETWLKAGKQIRIVGWEKISGKWQYQVRIMNQSDFDRYAIDRTLALASSLRSVNHEESESPPPE